MAKKSENARKLSTLRMPGFSAEASLYNSEYRYNSADAAGSNSDSGKVLPMFCFQNSEGGQTTCCDCFSFGSFGAFDFCYCYPLKALQAVMNVQ